MRHISSSIQHQVQSAYVQQQQNQFQQQVAGQHMFVPANRIPGMFGEGETWYPENVGEMQDHFLQQNPMQGSQVQNFLPQYSQVQQPEQLQV